MASAARSAPRAAEAEAAPREAGSRQRGDVSMHALQLLSFEIVRMFDEGQQYAQLEALGFQVGHRFVERFVRHQARSDKTLEMIKFLCKDLWSAMFGKNVDKLQTNHKGVFVLHDNSFSWVTSVDVDYRDEQSLDEAKKFLIMPCGLIRGALTNLGIACTVRAEFSTLPACFFNIQVHEDVAPASSSS